MMRRLTNKEKKEIRDTIKSNLEKDYIENYPVWKSSLIDVNDIIKMETKKCLLITPFDDDLLYTYDQLCVDSLDIVDSLSFDGSIDPSVISKDITQQITYNKLSNILVTYLYNNYEY